MKDQDRTALDAAIVGSRLSIVWVSLCTVYTWWNCAHGGVSVWEAVPLLGFSVLGAFLIFFFGIFPSAALLDTQRSKPRYLVLTVCALLADLGFGVFSVSRLGGAG
jgi:hypothetical protein